MGSCWQTPPRGDDDAVTTMSGMNTPSEELSAGMKACSSRSTMVTKPAMTTTNIARRMSFGMALRSAEMHTLQQVRMMRTERPMPMPLNSVVVMAMVEHMPDTLHEHRVVGDEALFELLFEIHCTPPFNPAP